MKTTLDLPDELVREMKLRAMMQGRTLRDLATELIRQGLGMVVPRTVPTLPLSSMVVIGSNGIPTVRCNSNAPATRMDVDALLALEQTTQTSEDMQRAGFAI